MREVKPIRRSGRPRRDRSRISSKNQVTLPLSALQAAGLGRGDTVRVVSDGPGRLVLTREANPVTTFAGALTGVYGPGYLDELRDEWD